VLGVGGDGVEPLGQREGEDQTRKKREVEKGWRRRKAQGATRMSLTSGSSTVGGARER
jgi:hypothetical protein